MPAPKIATKTKPAIIILGSVALALILMWVFAYSPTLAKRADAQTGLQEASDNNQNLAMQVAKLKGAAKNKELLAAQVAAFVKQFPSSADQPGTFAAIQAAAKTAKVTVNSFTSSVPAQATSAVLPTGASNLATARPGLTVAPVVPVAPEVPVAGAPAVSFPIAEVQVSLKVTGDMSSVTQFIKLLEALNRPVLVDSVSMSGGLAAQPAGATGAAVSTGSADMVLRVFIAKPLDDPSTSTTVATTAAVASTPGS